MILFQLAYEVIQISHFGDIAAERLNAFAEPARRGIKRCLPMLAS